MTSYFAKQLFDGKQIHQNVRMEVENGYISALHHDAELQGSSDQCLEGLVSAGFIDLQVNGGGGVLFNHDQSTESLERIFHGHAKYGTTSMLPTLITDSIDTMKHAANAVCETLSKASTGIVGVHFEGPHLSVAKKGIHAQTHIRSIDDSELSILTRKDIGKVLVTVAPENVPNDVIADLVSQGVCVSLGHSNADLDTVLAAIDAGASCTTHLYNAMSGLQARVPGLIAAALVDKRLYSGLIVDLQHVHAYNCLLAYNNIGAERLVLVTDAMAHVGSDIKTMPWLDTTITKVGDRLSLDDGSIAGSCLDMAQAVYNMYHILRKHRATDSTHKLSTEVLNMASQTPASLLQLPEIGSLKEGKRADFVVLDDALLLQATFVRGKLIQTD